MTSREEALENLFTNPRFDKGWEHMEQQAGGNAMTKDKTCAERITEHLQGRMADFRAYQDELVAENGNDELPPVNEYPLGVGEAKVYSIDLSTGGPGDWLEVMVRAGEIIRAEYHFQDWGDHASQNLTGQEFKDAVTFAQNFIDLDA